MHPQGPGRPGEPRRIVAPGDPPLAGDRAPPRGVDVKQPPPGRPGPGDPSREVRRPSGVPGSGIRDPEVPEGWSGPGFQGPPPGETRETGVPGSEVPGRPAPRTGFYINPSRRGPVPGREGSPGPVPGQALRGLSGGPFPTPAPGGLQTPFSDPRDGDRAPPRGVDVKATPAGSREPGISAPF